MMACVHSAESTTDIMNVYAQSRFPTAQVNLDLYNLCTCMWVGMGLGT